MMIKLTSYKNKTTLVKDKHMFKLHILVADM